MLVTTIPALEAQVGMIDYTFLLPGKNEICKLRSAGTERLWESVSRLEAERSDGRSRFCEVKQGRPKKRNGA